MTHALTSEEAAADRISALVGAPLTGIVAVDEGGYSPARRWRVTWDPAVGAGHASGAAFAKLGTERYSASGIRAEHSVYVDFELACTPGVIAYDDHAGSDEPLLVIDDLGAAHWAPPWSGVTLEQLLASLDEFQAVRVPAYLQRRDPGLGDRQEWVRVAEDPREFLKAEVCTRDWMVAALPKLAAGADRFTPTGATLRHGDLFPQNWCIAPHGPVFVDWAGASVGNPEADRVHLLHGVRVTGGPWSDEIEQLVSADSVAWFAGRLAEWAAQRRATKPARFLETQRRELWHGLCWAASVHGLPQPELPAGVAPIGDYRP